MKPYIKHVFWLYTFMFVIVVVHLLKVSLWDSKDFVGNPYNPRINSTSGYIKRGSILDINGNVLAQSVLSEDGTYKRDYMGSSYFAHITGYTGRGKTGIESKYNYILERVSNELIQNLGGVFAHKDIKGDDVVLTIDKDLQIFAAEQLGSSRGAIVALEPESGKILAQVSKPSFNPDSINEDWDYLNSEDANSPLLSRATQGLYPPGSIFKIITASAALEYDPSLKDYTMECYGEKDFGYHTMHCFNSIEHGHEDMKEAFAQSCNTYFATIGMEIGPRNIIKAANDFGFGEETGYDLESSKPLFSLTEDATTSEIIETSIGQGKTMVSPLFMAMVTGAIANDGLMMKPYIFDHSVNNWGFEENRTIPEKLRQVVDPETASEIKELMKEVVNSGTAEDAGFYVRPGTDVISSDSSVSSGNVSSEPVYVQVAGKTGTAENSSGDDHAWFVAFAPADDPKIAVAVILENAGKGSKAVPITSDIMKYYMENCMN